MRRSWTALILGLIIVGLFSAPVMALPELETVDYVDVEKYLGKWYSIAEIPRWFSPSCYGVTAEYSLREDGGVDVVNSCRRGGLDGEERSIRARAYVVDEETNAKLEVRFFWGLVRGDYWIIELGDDYEYAVVGEPSRRSLWILSREPYLEEELLEDILERVAAQGYDPDDLFYPWEEK